MSLDYLNRAGLVAIVVDPEHEGFGQIASFERFGTFADGDHTLALADGSYAELNEGWPRERLPQFLALSNNSPVSVLLALALPNLKDELLARWQLGDRKGFIALLDSACVDQDT